VTSLAALIRRDIKIALRVGGGALIGVLFFLTVTVLMPFAIGPDLALLTRRGPAILSPSTACSRRTTRMARST